MTCGELRDGRPEIRARWRTPDMKRPGGKEIGFFLARLCRVDCFFDLPPAPNEGMGMGKTAQWDKRLIWGALKIKAE